MRIVPIKTRRVIVGEGSLFSVLDRYINHLNEESILAVTSKIVAICEGRVLKAAGEDLEELVKQEADYYLPFKEGSGATLTIKYDRLIPGAGIDESNSDAHYVLWPANPQQCANQIVDYLRARFSLQKVGVIITDSNTVPMRRGTIGVAIAHSGFAGLRSYIGLPDIFGRELKVTRANLVDGLAAACVLLMGEGRELNPLAIVENASFVSFQEVHPTDEELEQLRISAEDDLYGRLLKGTDWEKGNGAILTSVLTPTDI